ncbi:ParB/RepB/Spo0J family partition protein [Azospirillum sp.]|uniref:ParB/RepB/Spo0J family partition protein n=1 Tax=Azospirillum sp. TaxID=34012 RepID=UPI002D35886C|nr:ParB N-terminal domain-containing protein [Azospirillum sp.]HYD66115.1 ParB N-terminal domain-containing protein [Azospirillum sp.]
MDMQIPLNRLKFGQDDGAGINARVAGRQDGIAELAANLHAQGQIENLIVKDAGGGFYSVANGNRRLAAFHMIYTADSDQPINCTLHDVDETRAFEFSLTTAITAKQLHPVDQYEAFARLEERGKTHEEIARQYGMTEKEVRQALALGRLSPKIRDAWRAGEIRAEVARAFTLALGHDTQDKTFDKLHAEGRLYETFVKKELGAGAVDASVTQLLDVVGIEAYRNAGGDVTEDLFGTSHIISNEVLLKQMARQLLISKCEELQADGWAWAEINEDLPHGARYWSQSQPKHLDYQGDEKARYDALDAKLQSLEEDSDLSYNEQEELQQKLEAEMAEITSAVRARSLESKKRKQLGCIVDVENGRIVILYGVKKPDEARLPSQTPADEPAKPGKKAAAVTPAEADEADISQALLHRLSVQLTKAAATALIQDEQLALSVLIAGVGCYSNCGVKASISGLGSRDERSVLGAEDMKRALPLAQKLKPAERITLLTQLAANALDFQHTSTDHNDPHDGAMAIVNAIDAKAFNAAARGAFDAKDYFGGVSKALCLKAIEEAMGPDIARQQGKNGKPDIVAFAVENVALTGWLPLQLRAKGYDGPPVAKGKVVALSGKAKKPAKAAPAKRAASAKKAAKKTSAKKKR